MKSHIVLGFILVLSLSGCNAIQATSGTVTDVAPQAMLAAKKSLIAAHSLHEAAADALTVAATTDLCKATCAVQAKAYLDQSESYLVAADALVKLGDAPGISAKISGATALISQVQALTGKK